MIVTIRGSHGNLRVDRATGFIVDHEAYELDEGEVGYADILYIDPASLAPGKDACLDSYGETDILCVSFVDDSGRLTSALPWDTDEEMWVEPFALLPHYAPQGSN